MALSWDHVCVEQLELNLDNLNNFIHHYVENLSLISQMFYTHWPLHPLTQLLRLALNHEPPPQLWPPFQLQQDERSGVSYDDELYL